MTMPCYKISESMITTICYKSGDNNKSGNNENKVCLIPRIWGW